MTSRLEKKAEKQLLRNTLLAVAGIIVICILLVKFGLQFLINFSLKLENANKNMPQSANVSNPTYIAPPILYPLPTATNSAEITVSGYSLPHQQVVLYVNGSVADRTMTNSDKSFSFQKVPLQSGQNSIKAKVVADNNQQSDYSDNQTVIYNNKAPTLSVTSPQDGQTFKGDNHITISGKTDPNDTVTINDFQAIVDDNGNFSYTMALQNGDTTLNVVATDSAGNKTTKQIKVHFSQ